ncbi:hypothetical protein COO60DRAFT_67808 [Scenedesmus sp. NREL 46B-D3]|nr:hypothetical protein COO60DRAFT_67808 [Scenedesmus sp. NREL 46B-D3]
MTSSNRWLHPQRQLLGVLLIFVLTSIKGVVAQTLLCRKFSQRSQSNAQINFAAKDWSCFLQNPCGGTGLGYSAFNFSAPCSGGATGCEALPAQYSGECSRWIINTTADGTPCPSFTCCSDGSENAVEMAALCSSQVPAQTCYEQQPGDLACKTTLCPPGLHHPRHLRRRGHPFRRSPHLPHPSSRRRSPKRQPQRQAAAQTLLRSSSSRHPRSQLGCLPRPCACRLHRRHHLPAQATT